MKTRLFFLLLFCSPGVHAQWWYKPFHLSDTAFKAGTIYRSYSIVFDLNGHSYIQPQSYPCLDSLADFLIAHPGMIIEIGSYTDQRGSDSANVKLSTQRANNVKAYLLAHGVPDHMLIAVGYGEQPAIHEQSKILKASDKAEQEKMYQENRRMEFKILRIPDKFFTLHDQSYHPGDILRFYGIVEFQKPGVFPGSRPFLDSVVDWMNRFPGIVIQIDGYTESRGSESSNMLLGAKRAWLIRDYLFEKGISQERVIAYGAGEKHLLVSDAEILRYPDVPVQDSLHSINTRIEFKILHTRGLHFTLQDTAFEEGQILRCPMRYALGKGTIDSSSYPFLDSLAALLIAHPELYVEIGVHTDSRARASSSTHLSSQRARSISTYLIQKGVNKESFITRGYEGTRPLITEKQINLAATLEEKEKLHAQNRRTEIKILEIR